ncbi:hypothetical protein [Lactobacillus delbrueckii]|nr:hypothetical protein [Lactobacillus delbrueckii]
MSLLKGRICQFAVGKTKAKAAVAIERESLPRKGVLFVHSDWADQK